jgi:hypothetical protein
MPWWRFSPGMSSAEIAWASLVAVLAHRFGRAAADAVDHFGLIGGIVVAVC